MEMVGTVSHLHDALQPAAVIIVAVAGWIIDGGQIDPQDLRVVEQNVALAGIEEDSVGAKLHPE
jgi:hypothetical protein